MCLGQGDDAEGIPGRGNGLSRGIDSTRQGGDSKQPLTNTKELESGEGVRDRGQSAGP